RDGEGAARAPAGRRRDRAGLKTAEHGGGEIGAGEDDRAVEAVRRGDRTCGGGAAILNDRQTRGAARDTESRRRDDHGEAGRARDGPAPSLRLKRVSSGWSVAGHADGHAAGGAAIR